MFLFLARVCLSSALLLMVGCQKSCNDLMKDVLLTPRYFKDGTPGDLQVAYSGNNTLECGGYFDVVPALQAPTVTYDVQGKCDNVSIIAFDPDTLFPCNLRIFLHWFAVNIPAAVLKSGYQQGQAGYEVSSYYPPGTPSGSHRYTFCAYCQKSYIEEKHAYVDILSRMGVNPKSVVQKYGLEDAVACKFAYLILDHRKPMNKQIDDILKYLSNRDKVLTCKD